MFRGMINHYFIGDLMVIKTIIHGDLMINGDLMEFITTILMVI